MADIPSTPQQLDLLTGRIRLLLLLFMLGLVISGATALPLESEIKWLTRIIEATSSARWAPSGLLPWLDQVRDGLSKTNAQYPFIAYGTDWLAFGHFVIALAFIGPLRDPVKNVWVIEFGMIACALVLPWAFIMGAVRGIPLSWRLVDCSFGVFGIVPLWFARKYIRQLGGAGASASGRRQRSTLLVPGQRPACRTADRR